MFCTYLDSQLPPLPQPGGRAFFNRYVVSGDKKSPKEIIAEVKNKTKCAILCTNVMKPKLNFISDGKIHNCVHVSDEKTVEIAKDLGKAGRVKREVLTLQFNCRLEFLIATVADVE